MHNPQLEYDFNATVTCPDCGERVDALFYACSCCRRCDGQCPECDASIDYDATDEGVSARESAADAAIEAFIDARSA